MRATAPPIASVRGVMFSVSLERALLLRDQAGVLRPIEGPLLQGETPRQAIARCVWERTGLSMYPEQWGTFDSTVPGRYLMTCVPQRLQRLMTQAIAIGGETPEVHRVDDLKGDLRGLVVRARQWLEDRMFEARIAGG